MTHNNTGFTLLELSIVLVIIGLIAGGITVGADMIRAAELRAIITEHDRFQTATNTFRDKYFGYPGDINNATDFWGSMTNCGVASPSGTGTQTCDGDADGVIDSASALSRTGETFGFWKQLANAGLVEGDFSGIAGSGGVDDAEVITSVNAPQSKLAGTGWMVINSPAPTNYFSGISYGNSFVFGMDDAAGYTHGAALNAEDAWNIDKKVDDGKPAQGSIIATAYNTCTDGSGATDYTADYDLDDTSIGCALIFRNQF